MNGAFFWCYPWDLMAEGLESSLGRLSGEVGVKAVSVAATTRSVVQIRPRLTPRWHRQAAAAHFQPSERHYGATRIRPSLAAGIRTKNPLEQIARAAEQAKLKLRVRVTCCEGEALVARFPMAGCVDVQGEPDPARLCPCNAEVREYVASLADDLSSNYPVATVELDAVDLGTPGRRFAGVERGTLGTRLEETLLSLCFCAACRHRAADAGIDVDAVAACVRDRLDGLLCLDATGADSLESMEAEHPALRSYLESGREAVTSLVRMVRERVAGPLVVHVDPDGLGGVCPSRLAATCDGLAAMWVSGSGRSAADRVGALVSKVGDPSRVTIGLPCDPAEFPDGPSLVRTMHGLCRAGHADIGFWHYGITSEPSLQSARRAIRYAQRETSVPPAVEKPSEKIA